MPLTLADIEEPTARLDITFRPGVVLHLVYRTDIVSPARIARWTRMAQEAGAGQLEEVVRGLCDMVVEWDLAGPVPSDGSVVPPGKPVPIKPEVVSHLPTRLLVRLFLEIAQHLSLPNQPSAVA